MVETALAQIDTMARPERSTNQLASWYYGAYKLCDSCAGIGINRFSKKLEYYKRLSEIYINRAAEENLRVVDEYHEEQSPSFLLRKI
jgi:hypothetical protein